MIQKDLKNAKILIVDDLESNIVLLTILLKTEGYTNINSTTDPRTVVGLLTTFNPDLILLDLSMPYLSGFEVMGLIKEKISKSLNPNQYLPILVLTADDTSDSKHKALQAGAKDFITKPFDSIEISSRIKNLLETQFLYQQLKTRNEFLEEKIIEFLKVQDQWYK